jgi:hypothetical protein
MDVMYEVVSESSRIAIVLTAIVKEDETGCQGRTSESLLHPSATWHRVMSIHCVYTSIFSNSLFVLSAIEDKISNVPASRFARISVNPLPR